MIHPERRMESRKAIDELMYMHWKPVKALGGDNYPYNDLECSNCGYRVKMVPKEWVYCPHCGKLDRQA